MKRESYSRIIVSIAIAIIAVLLGYFVEPLMAVLGLLIAVSTVGVTVIQHYEQGNHQMQTAAEFSKS